MTEDQKPARPQEHQAYDESPALPANASQKLSTAHDILQQLKETIRDDVTKAGPTTDGPFGPDGKRRLNWCRRINVALDLLVEAAKCSQ